MVLHKIGAYSASTTPSAFIKSKLSRIPLSLSQYLQNVHRTSPTRTFNHALRPHLRHLWHRRRPHVLHNHPALGSLCISTPRPGRARRRPPMHSLASHRVRGLPAETPLIPQYTEEGGGGMRPSLRRVFCCSEDFFVGSFKFHDVVCMSSFHIFQFRSFTLY